MNQFLCMILSIYLIATPQGLGGKGGIGGKASAGGGASVSAGIVYVTSSYAKQDLGTCGNTCTQTLGITGVAGGIILVNMRWQGSSTTISTLTGTNGTCTLLTGTTGWSDVTNNLAGISGYCLPTSSVSYTVSALMSTGTFQFNIQIAEYTGQNVTTPIDTSNVSLNPTCLTTTCDSATVTTTVANDLVVSMGQENSGNGQNFSAGTGATLRSSASAQQALQDQVQASAGSVTPNWTSTANLGGIASATIALHP